MASESYPRPGFNSGEVTELLYERLVSPQAPDGLIGYPTDTPLVFADNNGTRMVRLRANRRALVRGFQYDTGSTDISLQLPANTSGATRTDLIVLRLNRATWRVQETYVQGTPGQGAPNPMSQVNSGGVWDLPVARVTVAHNAGALAPATVTPVGWYINADGQILCTPTTRPPHERGRHIFEPSTSREYVSTGTQWILFAAPTTVTVANTTLSGWTIGTDSAVIVSGSRVDVRLGSWTRTGGNVAATVDVRLPCTIPASARYPDRDRRTTVYLSGGRIGHITVFSGGHPQRAGQVWLTSHPGLSTGNDVLGGDMTWHLP